MITGGTLAQHTAIREALTWCPPLKRDITITLGNANQGGYTGFVVMDFLHGADLQLVCLHEYGHVWERHWLTWADRQRVLDAVGRTAWRDDSQGWNFEPSEQWAGAFARHVGAEHLDVNTQLTHGDNIPLNLVAELIAQYAAPIPEPEPEEPGMASTEQIRKWYHAGVVLNHAQRGSAGYWPQCDHNQPKVAFPNDTGGHYHEPVHPLTVEAFKAYVAAMAHHGETMPSGGGVNSCRNIAGTAWPSLHAYLCAVDLPPNHRKDNLFIRDIEAIRTNSGARVFTNLWFDRMHDQINCSPADLATGIDWTTVPGEDDMTPEEREALHEWMAVRSELGRLAPPTTASWAKALIEAHRAGGSDPDIAAAIAAHAGNPDAHHA